MTYYKELAHVIMETEKSHDLPFVSWRPWKSSGAIPVQVQGPENQGSQRRKSTSKDWRPMSCLSMQTLLPFSFTFWSLWVLTTLDETHPHWGGQATY